MTSTIVKKANWRTYTVRASCGHDETVEIGARVGAADRLETLAIAAAYACTRCKARDPLERAAEQLVEERALMAFERGGERRYIRPPDYPSEAHFRGGGQDSPVAEARAAANERRAQEYLRLTRAGVLQREIAEFEGYSHLTVTRILRLYGGQTRPAVWDQWEQEHREKADQYAALVRQGLTQAQVAERVGVDSLTVSRTLRRAGYSGHQLRREAKARKKREDAA